MGQQTIKTSWTEQNQTQVFLYFSKQHFRSKYVSLGTELFLVKSNIGSEKTWVWTKFVPKKLFNQYEIVGPKKSKLIWVQTIIVYKKIKVGKKELSKNLKNHKISCIFWDFVIILSFFDPKNDHPMPCFLSLWL